jgi:hypothetical protein
MNGNSIKLTREELYERVWGTPATKLAKEFGISDVALGKICKKFDIPKPFPGYWQRIASGYNVRRTPLPAQKAGTQKQITIDPTTVTAPAPLPPEVVARIEVENAPENRICVADTLRGCHSLIRQTKQGIEKARPDEYGRLHGHLDLHVSKPSLNRALRIIDALVRAAEQRGYAIENSKQSPYPTQMVIGEESIRFKLFEKSNRRDRELTAEEKRKPAHEIRDRSIYTPSGVLSFEIDEYTDYWQRRWTDRPNKPLEEQLNDIMIGFIVTAEALRARRLRWEEEARQRREAERRYHIEEKRRGTLNKHVESWHHCRLLREYLQACEQSIATGKDALEPSSGGVRWLAWARGYADRLDPLKNGRLEMAVHEFTEDDKI